MWRSSKKEEWERRKSYLIRSLFEDIPVLSPIYESQESVSPSPHDYIYRCESPLPDLIIEKEPTKLNPHDESDEFYEKLAKEMRRLYKRDFLNIFEDTCSDNSSYEEATENYLEEDKTDADVNKEIKTLYLEKPVETPSTNSSNNLVQEFVEGEISEEEESASTSAFTGSIESDQYCGQQILIQAEVHQEIYKKTVKPSLQDVLYKSIEMDIREIDSTKSTEDSISIENKQISDGDITTIADQEVSKDLAKSKGASEGSNTSNSYNIQNQISPEIMRRRQTLVFRDSLSFRGLLPSYENADKIVRENVAMEVDSTILSEDIIATGRELEIAEFSPTDLNLQCTVTSTPKSSRKILRSQSRISKRCRKNLVSYSSSSNGFKNDDANAASQTSFSDDEPDWKNLWNNFFLGIPTVYKLCTCENHVCS